jgi:hypothetical protein
MRATEIIRNVLDLIDQVDQMSDESNQETAKDFYDDEQRRFDQISDLLNVDSGLYNNSPVEVVSDIEAVTVKAGGGVNGPKHPADIRSDSVSMYPGKVFGAQ